MTSCPQCGAELRAGARFCPSCGSVVEPPAVEPAPVEPPTGARPIFDTPPIFEPLPIEATPILEVEPEVEPEIVQLPAPTPPRRPRRRRSARARVILGLALGIVVAGVLVAAFASWYSSSSEERRISAELAGDARDYQLWIERRFAPAEAATGLVNEEANRLAATKSTAVGGLAARAKRAGDEWRAVKSDVTEHEVRNELVPARQQFVRAAGLRHEAYRTLVDWLSTGTESKVAVYRRKLEQADGAVTRALAELFAAGAPVPSPDVG